MIAQENNAKISTGQQDVLALQIPNELEELRSEIENVINSIAELRDRLHPVLREDLPIESLDEKKAEIALVPMAHSIRAHRNSVKGVHQDILLLLKSIQI